MPASPVFERLPDIGGDEVTLSVDGEPVTARAGDSLAAALLAAGILACRTTAVSGAPRAPYCMMGVCFECLVEIDGVPARQSCIVTIQEGMHVRRQIGAASLDDVGFGEES